LEPIELDFRHIEPTSVNWCEVKLKLIQQMACLFWFEVLIKCFRFVGVEIILTAKSSWN